MNWFLDPIRYHYADFSGRSTRQQYGMFVLLSFIIFFLLNLVLSVIGSIIGLPGLVYLIYLFSLAIFLPSIAIAVRRLHDIGYSGWLWLLSLIPLVNLFFLLFLLVKKWEKHDNKYGPVVNAAATESNVYRSTSDDVINQSVETESPDNLTQ